MLNFIIAVLYLSFFWISSFFFFFIAVIIRILTLPFDRKLIILNLFSSFWASCYLWCVPTWKIEKTGMEKFNRHKNYIVVSNHQSQIDILLAFNLFIPFRWVSKIEVFYLPFLGWNMFLNKYVGIKRGDKNSVKKMMQKCEAILEQGCSLFFFPEGTRSETGELKPFKPGAFILAKKMKVNILPVIMQGTKDVLKKNSLRFNWKHSMSIKMLDEIGYEEFKSISPEETADMVRSLFLKNMGGN